MKPETSRNGDLAYRTYLQVTLPEIGQDLNNSGDVYARWLDFPGEQLISQVEVEIGGQRIDRQYGDWMHIWNQLTLSKEQERGYYKMIVSGRVTNFLQGAHVTPLTDDATMSTLDDAATRALFNELDTDKSGFIELGELTAFFKKHGKDVSDMEIGKAMGKADTNNDDKLSFEEFKKVFDQNRKELPFGLQTVVDLGKALFEKKAPPIFSPKPGKYYIVNVNSGMFAYVCDGNGMDNGDRLAQWENMSYASQWELKCVSGEQYTIKHVRSGKFMNVGGGLIQKNNGAQLQLYDNVKDLTSTRWYFHADARYMLGEKTVYNISNRHSGKFINVKDGRKDNGALLIQWDNPESSHSQWYLKKVPE